MAKLKQQPALKFVAFFVGFLLLSILLINVYPNNSPTNEFAQQLIYRHERGEVHTLKFVGSSIYWLMSLGERVISSLDQMVPFFPSVLKIWWWSPHFIQVLILLPLITTIAYFLTKVPDGLFFITFLYLIWMVPIQRVAQGGIDTLIVKYNINYNFPWSKRVVMLEPSTPVEDSKYVNYVYQWEQLQEPNFASINLSCLGHYRLMVNGQRIYHGPNFGVFPTIYYDQVNIVDFVHLGENKIEVLCSFVDGETFEYPEYDRPAVVVGGTIDDGILDHSLSSYRFWQHQPFVQILPGERVFNAGYVENYNWIREPNELKPVNLSNQRHISGQKYSLELNPVKQLQYQLVELEKIRSGVYNLGKFTTGYLKINSNQPESCSLDLLMGDELARNGHPLEYMNQEISIQLPTGEHNFEIFSRVAGSYVGLAGECDLDQISIEFDQVYRPLALPKSPSNITDLDQQIFDLNLNSMVNNLQNHIEDSVVREKAMYLGDAISAGQCLLSVDQSEPNYDQNLQLVRDAVTKFAERQNQDGSFPSMASSSSDQFIPGFSLQWPTLLNLYLQADPDPELAKEMWPHFENWLAWAESNESELGLFYNKHSIEKWWDFIDWSLVSTGSTYSTSYQIWYLESLRAGAAVANLIDEEDVALLKKSDEIKAKVQDLAYDEQAGIFMDTFSEDDRSGTSLVTNALAGKVGIFPDLDSQERAVRYFRNNLYTNSPYSQSWVINWLINAQEPEMALTTLRGYWGSMIRDGASSNFEKYHPIDNRNPGEFDSRSHVWGCGPVYLYEQIYQNLES